MVALEVVDDKEVVFGPELMSLVLPPSPHHQPCHPWQMPITRRWSRMCCHVTEAWSVETTLTLNNKVQLLSPHNATQHMLKVVSIYNSGKSSLLLSVPTYLHCLYLIIRLFSNSHHPLLIICTTFLLIAWTAILSQSANLFSCNITKCYSDDLFIAVFPEVLIHKWWISLLRKVLQFPKLFNFIFM